MAGNIKLALVVPGSGLVKEQAEREGLDQIFKAAGFEWREPGCSMCLAMNADRLDPGEALRFHQQPPASKTDKARVVAPPGEPGHGCCSCHEEPLRRRSPIRLIHRIPIMQSIPHSQGPGGPMDQDNVDTDAIIPKQYLKSIKRTGFGPNLFDGGVTMMPVSLGKTRPLVELTPTSC